MFILIGMPKSALLKVERTDLRTQPEDNHCEIATYITDISVKKENGVL